MKMIAFACGLLILLTGISGIISPASLQPLTQLTTSTGAFLLLAAIRIVLGLILILGAPQSRMPSTIRVIGFIVLMIGIATAITAFMALEQAREIVSQWMQMGDAVIRLTGVVLVVVGSFIVFCFAPERTQVDGTKADS
ncbi:hypothetical protein [Dyella sp. 2HG41-7]|uniref:hypothetical protein n=1 Tax=Dyella sp. 2HG41-7 TaxID=2883239 RepID=UPI001F167B63|nr:hypothetical protein [Dyella sp. 2HG41-7]